MNLNFASDFSEASSHRKTFTSLSKLDKDIQRPEMLECCIECYYLYKDLKEFREEILQQCFFDIFDEMKASTMYMKEMMRYFLMYLNAKASLHLRCLSILTV